MSTVDWNEIGYSPGLGMVSLRTFASNRSRSDDYVRSFFRAEGCSPTVIDIFRGSSDPITEITLQLS